MIYLILDPSITLDGLKKSGTFSLELLVLIAECTARIYCQITNITALYIDMW